MSFDLELAGRRALVTAGTKGVGAAAVKALIVAGVKVVATARTVPDVAWHLIGVFLNFCGVRQAPALPYIARLIVFRR